MRVLTDENVSSAVIRGLRATGQDVLAEKESLAGATDQQILARAQAEQRLLLTHDKDFGELAFHAGAPATAGIILFRLSGGDPSADNWRVLSVLQSRTDWPGHFSVVTDDRIRMRPLPARVSNGGNE